jgi:hypothetical protein
MKITDSFNDQISTSNSLEINNLSPSLHDKFIYLKNKNIIIVSSSKRIIMIDSNSLIIK